MSDHGLITGLQFNSVHPDSIIHEWPKGYIFGPNGHLLTAQAEMHTLKQHLRPARLRTLMWVGQGDDLLHFPITAEEAIRIASFVVNAPLPIMLAIGAIGSAVPGYPWSMPTKEMPAAFLKCVVDVIAAIDKLCAVQLAPKPNLRWDLYNELEIMYDPGRWDTIQDYYAKALAACRAAGYPATVSAIGGATSPMDYTRVQATYDKLAANGGLPDFCDQHLNGMTNQQMDTDWKANVDALRALYNLPMAVGEWGPPANEEFNWQGWHGMASAMQTGEEVLLWL